MALQSLLIANRGEIAIRIARTAAELGIRTVSVFSEDDRFALHRTKCDESIALDGAGAVAYLDGTGLIAAAKQAGVEAIHPGYGFLAENAEFAAQCQAAGLTFVGPSPTILDLFGNKAKARALAEEVGVPVLPGTRSGITAEAATAFFKTLGPGGAMMLKAVAGGGGRGMRPVHTIATLEEAFARCSSEAKAAFGNGELYAEQLFPQARHIEIQLVGDGSGAVTHVWERECSLQRQRQKIVEMAPAPNLPAPLRDRLLAAAVQMGEAVRLDNLATVEFLVDASRWDDQSDFAFIETNARLQVEHTISEEVSGVDLVATQLDIAGGATLNELELTAPPPVRGHAVQLRVNLETMSPEGNARPSGGTLSAYEPPSGRGVRVDGYGYTGYTTNPSFDSLLAKVIAYVPAGDMNAAFVKAERALAEFKIAGVPTNLSFLRALLADDAVRAGKLHTGLVAERSADWIDAAASLRIAHFVEAEVDARPKLAGAQVDGRDPLAVLNYGQSNDGRNASPGASVANPAANPRENPAAEVSGPPNTEAVHAPMQGTIVTVNAEIDSPIRAGQPVLIMEAMKMEHEVLAATSGLVRAIAVAPGDTVFEGHPLLFIEAAAVDLSTADTVAAFDLDEIRPDLAEVIERKGKSLDVNRPEAVARRRKTGQSTVRENVDALIDPGTFIEYGALTLAARRMRLPMQELIDRTPADGLVCGLGLTNSVWFADDAARTMVVAYDYTVLAGTQGKKNHQKKDRMFKLAAQWRTPLVLFAEGGGGRPGDTDVMFGANLQVEAFHLFGKLSGLVPLVGITSGRCFAGNAVLLGCCDVVIATANSTIGMGGPAMIEGGGLGVYTPEEVGPMDVQVPNGVVDIAVADEVEAVTVARQYLSYFQGTVPEWDCADQRQLRRSIPENRLRVYDVREVIQTLCDTGSVLELRPGFGHGIVTALVRIEGKPMGLIANNPAHLGGAIDSEASDKAARFMQLCDAFDLPILSLCDTPGNMVGPEHERTALVRHCCRMFVVGANITVPLITVVLRKGYGLGAQGMAGGSFHAPLATISWPTGEFGGMGLEGAIKLGFRDVLAAIDDPAERLTEYEKRVAEMYEQGKAVSIASYFELDDVIDPAETRRWVLAALRSAPPPPMREGKKRPNIDTW